MPWGAKNHTAFAKQLVDPLERPHTVTIKPKLPPPPGVFQAGHHKPPSDRHAVSGLSKLTIQVTQSPRPLAQGHFSLSSHLAPRGENPHQRVEGESLGLGSWISNLLLLFSWTSAYSNLHLFLALFWNSTLFRKDAQMPSTP